MTHPTNRECRVHSGLEQEQRERDWDRDWAPIEALRETRHLGPVVGSIAIAAIGVYIGADLAGNGDPIAGVVGAAVSLAVGGLWLDTELCKGTPATVNECRRCRRETDRWRGPTRDDQWVASLIGQSSPAERTPAATRYDRGPPEPRDWVGEPEPAVWNVDRPGDPQQLYRTVPADRSARGGVGD
jgi:hypothetical protein